MNWLGAGSDAEMGIGTEFFLLMIVFRAAPLHVAVSVGVTDSIDCALLTSYLNWCCLDTLFHDQPPLHSCTEVHCTVCLINSFPRFSPPQTWARGLHRYPNPVDPGNVLLVFRAPVFLGLEIESKTR
jgi:hypothetical protein